MERSKEKIRETKTSFLNTHLSVLVTHYVNALGFQPSDCKIKIVILLSKFTISINNSLKDECS